MFYNLPFSGNAPMRKHQFSDIATFFGPYTFFWLARNGGMDHYSSPYITHYSSFHVLFHSFILTVNPKL